MVGPAVAAVVTEVVLPLQKMDHTNNSYRQAHTENLINVIQRHLVVIRSNYFLENTKHAGRDRGGVLGLVERPELGILLADVAELLVLELAIGRRGLRLIVHLAELVDRSQVFSGYEKVNYKLNSENIAIGAQNDVATRDNDNYNLNKLG